MLRGRQQGFVVPGGGQEGLWDAQGQAERALAGQGVGQGVWACQGEAAGPCGVVRGRKRGPRQAGA